MMKKIILACLLFIFTSANPLWAQDVSQIAMDEVPVLVNQVVLTGFVLNDRTQLDKIVKANRKKRLNQKQIDQIITEIKSIYLANGFAGLIEIDYKIVRRKLMIDIKLQK